LVAAHDVKLLIPASQREGTKATVNWNGPLQAPIAQGQELATLTINREGLSDVIVPLYAGQSIAKAGFGTRLGVAAQRVTALVLGDTTPPAPVQPIPATTEPVSN
jgi:D-alanyl-D-alanine carboxypeptidase (penicillin-binding protein 5/6)